jgi:hypothetical protein
MRIMAETIGQAGRFHNKQIARRTEEVRPARSPSILRKENEPQPERREVGRPEISTWSQMNADVR